MRFSQKKSLPGVEYANNIDQPIFLRLYEALVLWGI